MIVNVEKSFKKCPRAVISVLYFGHLSCIVSTSLNETIRIWDTELEDFVHEIFIKSIVYHAIKWGENSFLACSGNGCVSGFSINRNEKGIIFDSIKVCKTELSIAIRLVKLKDSKNDLYCCLYNSKRLHVRSFPKNKCISKLKKIGTVGINSKLVLSKFYINSIYFNECGEDNNVVLLISFNEPTKELCVLKTFSGFNQRIWGIETFVSSASSKEYLMCGGLDRIFVFDASSSSRIVKFHVSQIQTRYETRSIVVFREYLILGEKSGYFEIMRIGEIEKDEESKESLIEGEGVFCGGMHSKSIYDMKFMSYNPSRKIMKVLTCSVDKTLQILCIRNIELSERVKNNLVMKKDERERVLYLLFEENMMNPNDIFTISMGYGAIARVSRIFLL